MFEKSLLYFFMLLQIYFSTYLEQYNTVLQQLEHSKSEHDNWNLFQMCLTLLQTAGELLSEMKRLDEEIIQNIIDCSRKQTFTEFIPVLLLPSAQQELKDLINSIQDGEQKFKKMIKLMIKSFLLFLYHFNFFWNTSI